MALSLSAHPYFLSHCPITSLVINVFLMFFSKFKCSLFLKLLLLIWIYFTYYFVVLYCRLKYIFAIEICLVGHNNHHGFKKYGSTMQIRKIEQYHHNRAESSKPEASVVQLLWKRVSGWWTMSGTTSPVLF